MDISRKIRYCTTLTPAEQQLAKYILDNKDIVVNNSMQNLQECAFVSKSMIHRFCKKMGLEGFNELKVQLSQSQSYDDIDIDVNIPFVAKDSQRQVAEKLAQLYNKTVADTQGFLDMQVLWDVVLLMNKSTCIDIYTHANNLNAAENFQDKMLSIGRKVTCQESGYKQRRQVLLANSTHVALILSYSGKATFISPLLKLLKEQHVPIIWIGKAGNTEMAAATDYQLYLSDKEHFQSRLSQFASHIAMQYTMDLLFSCIFKMDYERNLDYLKHANLRLDDRKWQ